MILTTPELTVGMIVDCHNSKFRLIECTHNETAALYRAESAQNGARFYHPKDAAIIQEAYDREVSCRAFRTEYLGPVDAAYSEAIPASWRDSWTVQGNARAKWRVID